MDDVCEDEHSEEINRLFKCLDEDSSSSSSASKDKQKKTKKAWFIRFLLGVGQEKKPKEKKTKKTKREKKEKAEGKPPKPEVSEEQKQRAKRINDAKKVGLVRVFILTSAQAIGESSKKIKWAVALKPNLDTLPGPQ